MYIYILSINTIAFLSYISEYLLLLKNYKELLKIIFQKTIILFIVFYLWVSIVINFIYFQ